MLYMTAKNFRDRILSPFPIIKRKLRGQIHWQKRLHKRASKTVTDYYEREVNRDEDDNLGKNISKDVLIVKKALEY